MWFWSQSPNGKRYSNPEFDAKYLLTASELDSQKRAQAIKEASTLLQADPPWLGIVTGSVVAAWGPTVEMPSAISGDYWPLFDTIRRIDIR